MKLSLSYDLGPVLQVGTVLSVADGRSTVLLPGGGLLRVVGDEVPVVQRAFVRDGRIGGAAPDLPAYDLEV